MDHIVLHCKHTNLPLQREYRGSDVQEEGLCPGMIVLESSVVRGRPTGTDLMSDNQYQLCLKLSCYLSRGGFRLKRAKGDSVPVTVVSVCTKQHRHLIVVAYFLLTVTPEHVKV